MVLFICSNCLYLDPEILPKKQFWREVGGGGCIIQSSVKGESHDIKIKGTVNSKLNFF